MTLCSDRGGPIPNYLAHTTTNCLLGATLTYYGYYGQNVVDSHFVTVASLSFWAATFLLSPDLDLRHSIPTKNWGILKIIWWGYSKLFRHRGQSHSLLFASLTKVTYLAGVAFVFLCLFEVFSHWSANHSWGKSLLFSKEATVSILNESEKVLVEHKMDLLAAFCGLVINDWIHILSDRVYSVIRKVS